MKDLSSKSFRPAQGLKRLTWPQIEQIDAMIDALCQRTAKAGQVASALLTVVNGHLKSGTTTELMEELVPNRR